MPFEVPDSTLQKLEDDTNHTAPVSKAFQWLKNDPFLDDYNEKETLERYIMAIFYYATQGDAWTNRGDTVATVLIDGQFRLFIAVAACRTDPKGGFFIARRAYFIWRFQAFRFGDGKDPFVGDLYAF